MKFAGGNKYAANRKCFKKMDIKMTLPNSTTTTVKVSPPPPLPSLLHTSLALLPSHKSHLTLA
jgi:hypothetical protein